MDTMYQSTWWLRHALAIADDHSRVQSVDLTPDIAKGASKTILTHQRRFIRVAVPALAVLLFFSLSAPVRAAVMACDFSPGLPCVTLGATASTYADGDPLSMTSQGDVVGVTSSGLSGDTAAASAGSNYLAASALMPLGDPGGSLTGGGLGYLPGYDVVAQASFRDVIQYDGLVPATMTFSLSSDPVLSAESGTSDPSGVGGGMTVYPAYGSYYETVACGVGLGITLVGSLPICSGGYPVQNEIDLTVSPFEYIYLAGYLDAECFVTPGVACSATDPATIIISGIPADDLISATGGTYVPASTTVPEPATLSLLVLGLAGIGFARRRKKH